VPDLAIFGDAHLLMQAEWCEHEAEITQEGEEALENFRRAMDQMAQHSPEVVISAGDVFDYKTRSGQRVTHREGEKYMLRIWDAISSLTRGQGGNIYALKGNHDSEAVLRNLEKTTRGAFQYRGNQSVTIGDVSVFLLDSNYERGPYEIPAGRLPESGDVLVMHESVPIWGEQGLGNTALRDMSNRFRLVLNGHMHTFIPKTLGLSNFYCLPALIPSKEIKSNWTLRYRYPGGEKPETRKTPFGYVTVEGEKVRFEPYEPIQTVVRVEIDGEKPEDYLQGIRTIYDLLASSTDRDLLRVWVETTADRVTIDNVMRPKIAEYKEIRTMDVIGMIRQRTASMKEVSIENVLTGAYTLEELTDRIMAGLRGSEKDVAKELFQRVLTREALFTKRPNESLLFKQFLEILASRRKVSEAFITRAWDLAKEG
jgi:predicted phosphodiesterase